MTWPDYLLEEMGLMPVWIERGKIPPAEIPHEESRQQKCDMEVDPVMPAALSTSSSPLPVEQLDWESLAQCVAQCRLCKLCEKRTQTVFGTGNPDAAWMIVGEAPGENEDRQGQPFVGQAGKLLDSMLRALQMQRERDVYIANVLKCRPPGNRNPEPEEVMRCEPYLRRQVALVQPKLILAMGRFAAQSLLKTTASIASLRGRLHEYEGVPVVVTYHPAYLLRNLPDKAKAWSDLCFARSVYLREFGSHLTDNGAVVGLTENR